MRWGYIVRKTKFCPDAKTFDVWQTLEGFAQNLFWMTLQLVFAAKVFDAKVFLEKRLHWKVFSANCEWIIHF
jgi:hypothetical protein